MLNHISTDYTKLTFGTIYIYIYIYGVIFLATTINVVTYMTPVGRSAAILTHHILITCGGNAH
jgi:hypothetical protein